MCAPGSPIKREKNVREREKKELKKNMDASFEESFLENHHPGYLPCRNLIKTQCKIYASYK